MRQRFRFFTCLFLLLLTACSTVLPPGQFFEGATVDFTKRLRWMDYYGAARHLAPEHREPFLQLFTPLHDLHITDVTLQSAEPQPDGSIVTLNVLEYYLMPSTTVRTFHFRQEWAFRSESAGGPGIWLITTPFPDFPALRKP